MVTLLAAHEDHRIRKHTCVSLSQVLLSRTGASLLMGSGGRAGRWKKSVAAQGQRGEEATGVRVSAEVVGGGGRRHQSAAPFDRAPVLGLRGSSRQGHGRDLRQVGSLAQENVGGDALEADIVCFPVEVDECCAACVERRCVER